VYVSTRLQEELRSYINSRKWFEDTQALFTTYSSPRKAFTPNVLSQHFYWLFKAAGIKGASSHSGRKTFLTTLAAKGVSVFVLASLAGHRNISTTQLLNATSPSTTTLSAALLSWFDLYLRKSRRTEEQKERKQAAAAVANMVFL
jgi:integrase/recombinase XerD